MKYENQYTSPEQSKKLLSVGIPAETADFEWSKMVKNSYGLTPSVKCEWELMRKGNGHMIHGHMQYEYVPCWSIGRLIKILKLCVTNKEELHEIFEELEMCIDETKSLVQAFKEYSDVIDFSKLEE